MAPDWEIKLLNDIPNDPLNVYNYFDKNELANTFLEIKSKAAVGDIIKAAALYKYGGAVIDSSIMLL